MKTSQIKEKMARKFYKSYQNDFHFNIRPNVDVAGILEGEKNHIQKRWVKMSAEDIYSLLTACNNHIKPVANELLKQLACKKWTLIATAHEGGRNVNAPLHITLAVKNKVPYHLNCRENKLGKLYIYEVTQKPITGNDSHEE